MAPKKKTPKPAAKAKPVAKKKVAPKKKVAAPVVPLLDHQHQAVDHVERALDVLGEKIGDAGKIRSVTVHELRDKFDAIKHHEPFRILLALARLGLK